MSEPSALAKEALGLISGAPAFATLPPDERRRLAACVTEVQATPGELVVREGDRGDRMYFVASGAVQVLGRAFEGSELVLARLEAGQYFGEQALLGPGTSRRNASVRVATNSRLLALARQDLLLALDENSEFVRQLREAGEKQRELRRSQLREQVLRNLGVAEAYRVETYDAGQWVFRQGDPGEQVYLVLGGSARVVRHEGGAEVELAQLLPGQFFGELAILNSAPRAASVQAVTELELASLDGAWFRSALSTHPQLRSVMTSLETMYMLPNRGVLTLQAGNLGSQPTLTAVHHFHDGRRVVSTRLVGVPAFTARLIGAPEATMSARYADPDNGVMREIHLADNRIVEIEAEGPWAELGEVFGLLLDSAVVEDKLVDIFRDQGSFRAGATPVRRTDEIVCRCSNVSSEQILRAIEGGAHTLQDVARQTKATLVCGGCGPNVNELLGQTDWAAARCETVIRHTDTISSFKLRPLNGDFRPNLPGQHLVLQARIKDQWVQRPYTISSSPNTDGVYEITVKREPEGMLSRWLFDQLRSESLLRISKPAGVYFLPPDHAADVVCLVGGIGITPAIAIGRALAADPRPFRFYVDYSVSDDADVVFRSELEQFARENPNCHIRIRVTSREGRISADDVVRLARDYPNAAYYLCASRPYMDTVCRYLADAKIDAGQIHVEQFTIAGAKPA